MCPVRAGLFFTFLPTYLIVLFVRVVIICPASRVHPYSVGVQSEPDCCSSFCIQHVHVHVQDKRGACPVPPSSFYINLEGSLFLIFTPPDATHALVRGDKL